MITEDEFRPRSAFAQFYAFAGAQVFQIEMVASREPLEDRFNARGINHATPARRLAFVLRCVTIMSPTGRPNSCSSATKFDGALTSRT